MPLQRLSKEDTVGDLIAITITETHAIVLMLCKETLSGVGEVIQLDINTLSL